MGKLIVRRFIKHLTIISPALGEAKKKEMVFIVAFLVSTFCTLMDLVSMAIFKSMAMVIVLAIHALRVPGTLSDFLLKHVAQAVDWASSFVVEWASDLVKSAVSSVLEILRALIDGSVGMTSSGVAELMELTKSAYENTPAKAGELIQDLSKLFDSISSVWNNFMEAVAFVQERV